MTKYLLALNKSGHANERFFHAARIIQKGPLCNTELVALGNTVYYFVKMVLIIVYLMAGEACSLVMSGCQ